MSNTERRKILNYRNANGLSPNPNNIDYGEIAIGYKKDKETIYIKNSTNEIVDFTPISIVNLTYNELKNLRDNSKLKPSQYYRITDFVTTVANDPEARSAGHPFDIIVLATSPNTLNENAKVVKHEGDTYFANSNLDAWEIKYDLDNDTTKYAWADATNGKGVIFYMKDEFNNECPYDFKNVQFKRYWANGINIAKRDEPKYIILQGYYGTVSNTDLFTEGVDTDDYLFCFTFTRLNNILADYEKGSVIQSNVLDESIQTEGFDIDAKDDKLNNPNAYNFHNRCRNNILKPTEVGLLVDTKEYMALILLNNVFITVKEDEYEAYQPPFDNTLGLSCVNNTFGSNIYGLLFLSCCTNNTFGNGCSGNTFGNSCNYNSFGDDCSDNTFGNDCDSNSFGDYCSDNTFVNSCDSNSFGNDCGSNSFGNDCFNNTFGNACGSNSFGNSCNYNSFGVNFSGNTVGDYCHHNSFGDYCHHNSFGKYCAFNSFGNYFRYNALGNDVEFITIPIDKIYHTQILNGTKGVNDNKLTIQFTPETTYSQFAGLTSDGVLKIWVEADDIVNLTYNELKNLRDNSKLKPSQYYRITDFVTTVANDPEARSAGHPFDIIVLATSPNTLNENAKVVKHEGDTYFANSNLDAWELKYDLDNDKSKYAWADATNGKGVIYYLKDEFNNECFYDFKNVLFKRYKLKDKSGLHLADYPLENSNNANSIKQAFINWQNYLVSSMKSDNVSFYYTRGINGEYLVSGADIYGYDNSYDYYDGGKLKFDGNSGGSYVSVCNIYDTYDIIAEVEDTNGEWFYTFSKKATATSVAVDGSLNENCYSNSIKEYIISGIKNLNDNIFIYLGTDSNYRLYNNNLNVDCYSNTFGSNCNSNTFGIYCYSNTFGSNCNSNTFGSNCYSNTFGIYCYSNTFGSNCYSNTFGSDCDSNTFGSNCYSNTFGSDCNSNTFGSNCYSNTFGSNCNSNTFGNDCGSNTFGNYYYYNKIKFGNDGISFELYTTGSSMKIQYLTIYKVNDNTTIPANLITLNANYSQVLGLNSSGEVVCKPALD